MIEQIIGAICIFIAGILGYYWTIKPLVNYLNKKGDTNGNRIKNG